MSYTLQNQKRGGAKFRFVCDTEEKERNSEHYQKYYELLPYSRVWYELLILGFVKVTQGYVK
jgi:hypothetical protein